MDKLEKLVVTTLIVLIAAVFALGRESCAQPYVRGEWNVTNHSPYHELETVSDKLAVLALGYDWKIRGSYGNVGLIHLEGGHMSDPYYGGEDDKFDLEYIGVGAKFYFGAR